MGVICLNQRLADEWGWSKAFVEEGSVASWINGVKHPFAMAYAGHQYGHFTMLGDGRAMLAGEWQTDSGKCYDVHLKGTGPTPFARGGDGHATLRAMLREFLISEALHDLGVPTTRSLMVLETPNRVWRDTQERGGILFRVAPHHVRIGTLEYAVRAMNPEDYARYVGSVLGRTLQCWSGQESWVEGKSSYAADKPSPDVVIAFVEEWMKRQTDLIAHWMRVGFVHGVLNTDNISLLGATMDLGPCAFVNACDSTRSFSSIDAHGRYAWGRQADIMEWNTGVLLYCLLPLLGDGPEDPKAMQVARDLLDRYRGLSLEAIDRMDWAKLGLDYELLRDDVRLINLVSDWKAWLRVERPDYSLTYLHLESILLKSMEGDTAGYLDDEGRNIRENLPSSEWIEAWISVLNASGEGDTREALTCMQRTNPAIIPRNHRVEEALDQMVRQGRRDLWEQMLLAFQRPYERNTVNRTLNQAPPWGDAGYCTYCGT